MNPHVAIGHELLVRYLDAWLPTVMHGHKQVTYVDTAPESAAAAARVVCEFEDVLPKHPVTMVVGGTESAAAVLTTPPAGLTVLVTMGPLLAALRDAHALGAPLFAWLRAPVPDELLSTVAASRSAELVLIGADIDAESRLSAAGLALLARVDLVDGAGMAEHLCFATTSERSLEKFKDELWALDEYAGIRLRDPHDPDGTLLDISVSPQLGPLRRALVARIGPGAGATLAQLRTWTTHETIYRPGDTTKAVQSLLASGMLTRVPIGGRLSADTVLSARPDGSGDE